MGFFIFFNYSLKDKWGVDDTLLASETSLYFKMNNHWYKPWINVKLSRVAIPLDTFYYNNLIITAFCRELYTTFFLRLTFILPSQISAVAEFPCTGVPLTPPHRQLNRDALAVHGTTGYSVNPAAELLSRGRKKESAAVRVVYRQLTVSDPYTCSQCTYERTSVYLHGIPHADFFWGSSGIILVGHGDRLPPSSLSCSPCTIAATNLWHFLRNQRFGKRDTH